MVGESFDCSRHNIVYEFKTNTVLTVSAETEHYRQWPGTGEHFYSLIEEKRVGVSEFLLQINTLYRWYRINSRELVIDGSPLDGAIYYLIKIQ